MCVCVCVGVCPGYTATLLDRSFPNFAWRSCLSKGAIIGGKEFYRPRGAQKGSPFYAQN